jgi:hypothetical protein
MERPFPQRTSRLRGFLPISLWMRRTNDAVRHTNTFLPLLAPLRRSQKQPDLEMRASMARSRPRLSPTSPLRFEIEAFAYYIMADCVMVAGSFRSIIVTRLF